VTTTIGHSAGLTVSEARTTRFQKFEPFDWTAKEVAAE
jgi:hypothetical protein